MSSTSLPVGAVLVVGGGIAGMQASLDLAEQGFRVVLVESQSAIGGHMAQLDKTFPTNDCAMCTISPKLVETGRHLNIDVYTDTEVVRLEGQPGDFVVSLRRKPRFIDPARCVGCGDCAQVCPVSLPDLFNEGLSDRRAAHKLYPQAVPNAFAIDKRGTAPCRDACPAGQRAQGYIALIGEGRYREALRVIKEDNPFPSVCGRTCHHPCEGHCTRALVDEPVAIMSLKRFVVDYALAYGRERVEPAPRTRPGWVAVVGAGPAGLTAAHDLAKLGYGVTVYEALPVAGGMMRVGIPAHRLPKGVLQQDVDDILALGVVLKTNTPIADPVTLLGQGYDAVCLATGVASRERALGLDGEDSQGVLSAATFLRKVNLGEPISIGRRVAVLGGGITALDAAAVARRLGAEEIHLVLDRPRGELPAYHWEVAAVEAEGIRLYEHTTATRILADDGRVVGVELARAGKGMTNDAAGRRRPEVEQGTAFTLEVDTVIATAGQQSDLVFLDPRFDDLEGDPRTLASRIPGLFVVGGRKTGAAYIVEAVALGHRVAASIDRYLCGQPLQTAPEPRPVAKIPRAEAVQLAAAADKSHMPRHEPALLPMAERVTSFREVVLGLTERQARSEAQRCLACGQCAECLACNYACGAGAIDHSMAERDEQLRVGAVILAPGYRTYAAEEAQEFGFGRYPDVITSLQLERLLTASGPTAGQVRRPSDGATPRRVAFLQCIGSRDQHHDYCSAVCCMVATKQAILLKEHHPETEVHIFYMDVRAFSKGYSAYFQRAQKEHGIRYRRCRISAVWQDSSGQALTVRSADGDGGDPPAEEIFDLVVLSVGMEMPETTKELARTLGVEVNSDGFCQTEPYTPLETSRAGIFAAGPFRQPKDIPESVVDASGAAGLAAGLLSTARGTLTRTASYPEERDASAEPSRIGVFVCHCGSNIAASVDVEALARQAAALPGVAYADHLLYACSQDSTTTIRQRIQEHGLNRLVVASCTPLTHGPLFADCLRQAGLNPHLLAMANIRNHCAWVHADQPAVATGKAMDLVRMAVGRAACLEPLARQPMAVRQSALVIGGGPAGLTAALALADQGFPVHLVERESSLGGNLRLRHWVEAQSNEHAGPQAFLAGLVERVNTHPEISLHLASQLKRTVGFVGNFTSTIECQDRTTLDVQHGVTIVACGGREYRGPEYGFGADPHVLTQQQFEELLAQIAAGSETVAPPRRIVMIQCVGPAARTCTRICCTVALKNALVLKRLAPEVQIAILFRDLRAYGFGERLYQQALSQGVVFLRFDDQYLPEVDSSGSRPVVRVFDQTVNRWLALDADLVVLSMPMVPAEASRELATRLKVPVDLDGWFLEAHVKLRPVEFASEGMFVAGAAHYPKLLDETIAHAQAAASRAATILSRDSLMVGGAVAEVDTESCVGCLTCVRICPFGVPTIRPELVGRSGLPGAASIPAALCRGCGICVGECPAGAIELRHYTRRQVEQETLALFPTHPEVW